MAETEKRTGEDGRVQVPGGTVYVTQWEATVKKTTQESTDTSNFDAVTSRCWKAQLAVDYQAEGTMEGFYPFTGAAAKITDALFAKAAQQVTLYFDRNTPYGAGKFDFEDVKVTAPRDGVIKFSCGFKSNGVFTLS